MSSAFVMSVGSSLNQCDLAGTVIFKLHDMTLRNVFPPTHFSFNHNVHVHVTLLECQHNKLSMNYGCCFKLLRHFECNVFVKVF